MPLVEVFSFMFTCEQVLYSFDVRGNKWKQSNRPHVETEYIGFTHLMKYYKAVKRNEISLHISTLLNHKNLMQGKKSRLQKDITL